MTKQDMTIWLPPMKEPMTETEAAVAFWLNASDSLDDAERLLGSFISVDHIRSVIVDDWLPLAAVECRDSTALAAMAAFDNAIKRRINLCLEHHSPAE